MPLSATGAKTAGLGGSDASSELSELSSDGDKSEHASSSNEDPEDDDSETDRPFQSSSSSKRTASKKGKRKGAKATSVLRRPRSSNAKAQSPSKSTNQKAKAPSSSKQTALNSTKHSRHKSDSFSPTSPAALSSSRAPPSAASSTGPAADIPGESDEDDTNYNGRRSSRRGKRSAIVPGHMWDWAMKKSSGSKKDSAKSHRSGGGGSSHDSPSREADSPSRESENPASSLAKDDVEDKPPAATNGIGRPGAHRAERSQTLEDEEDVKPDINVLQSAVLGDAAGTSEGTAPEAPPVESTRTSPGLPLAIARARSLSRDTRPDARPSTVVDTTLRPPAGEPDAMDVDQGPLDSSAAESVAGGGLDILAQFAATLGEKDVKKTDADDAMSESVPLDDIAGGAASSEAGDDVNDQEGDDDAPETEKDGDAKVSQDTTELGDEGDEEDPTADNKDEDDDVDPDETKRDVVADQDTADPDVEDEMDEQDAAEETQDGAGPAAQDSDRESGDDAPTNNALADADDGPEGEVEQEVEQEAGNEIQSPLRVEALEILAAMELKFALLRERIFLDKMRDIAREEKMLNEGNHPEYLYLLSELQRRKDRKLNLAALRLEQEQSFASHKRKIGDQAIWSMWNETKDDVRDELVAETNAKRRRLDREKRALDYPRIGRATPTMPPSADFEPPSPKSLRQIIKQHTKQYSSPFAHAKFSGSNTPSLAPLTSEELAIDLEILTGGRKTISHQHPLQQVHSQSHYSSQGPYPPPLGYGQQAQSMQPYPPQQHGPPPSRYPPPLPGFGHGVDMNNIQYPMHPSQQSPIGYADAPYDPYVGGPPPSHYPLNGPPPPNQPYPPPLPPHQPYSQHPPPQQPGSHHHPQQPLHQPQPQHYAYRMHHREPSPGPPGPNPGPYPRNAWPSGNNAPYPAPPLNNGRDKVVIDLTRMTPEENAPGGMMSVHPPPNGAIPRPQSTSVKQDPLDRMPRDVERPQSSASRPGERLPSLTTQIPLNQPDPRSSPALAMYSSTTSSTPRPPSTHPRPGSSTPRLPGGNAASPPFPPGPRPQPPQLPLPSPSMNGPPPPNFPPPRASATPVSSLVNRHSQSPTVPKRTATPHGVFSPGMNPPLPPPPPPLPSAIGDP
ncbi:hypothetical protein FRB99_005336 [Tulasnella sp. 403]|nr:hypothetical protein FRB99_005336 [Tulasnella sp. 403]